MTWSTSLAMVQRMRSSLKLSVSVSGSSLSFLDLGLNTFFSKRLSVAGRLEASCMMFSPKRLVINGNKVRKFIFLSNNTAKNLSEKIVGNKSKQK